MVEHFFNAKIHQFNNAQNNIVMRVVLVCIFQVVPKSGLQKPQPGSFNNFTALNPPKCGVYHASVYFPFSNGLPKCFKSEQECA